MSRALLACVQSPVLVQLVLPVQTAWGCLSASQIMRNLLCASARGALKTVFQIADRSGSGPHAIFD
jgi:hypothetical protein